MKTRYLGVTVVVRAAFVEMLTINGKYIALLHTVCSSTAFLVAFMVGYYLHFHKIVENAWYGYPEEWFPSVSATIGDRYPERSLFQILIALTALPRFLLLFSHYYLNGSIIALVVGIVRTVTCGGWVYITSTDDHNIHDIFMISYIVLTLPWDYLVIKHSKFKKWKIIAMSLFFFTLIPLVYWFIQHQIHRRAGAYSIYAYFEWSLIILDVSFDAFAYEDFGAIQIRLSTLDEEEEEEEEVELMEVEVETEVIEIGNSDQGVEYEKLNDSSVEDTSDDEYIQQEHSRLLESNQEEITILLRETQDLVYPKEFPIPPEQSSFIYIAVNVFSSFMFWTTLTSLLCMLWHFPLWYLGISGYEAVVLATLSPFLVNLPLVSVLVGQYGVLLSYLLSIGAYLIETPESRLITVAIATSISVMVFTLQLNALNKETIANFSYTWSLGLILSVIVKMGFWSNNPFWAIMNDQNGGHNLFGLIVSFCFALITPFVNARHSMNSRTLEERLCWSQKFLVSVGFGSLIFAIHQSLTDSSTLIYWCWEGWNDHKGPLAWPYSALVCSVMILGVFTGKRRLWTLCLTLIASTFVLASPKIIEWNKFCFGVLPYVISIIWAVPSYLKLINVSNSPSLMTFSFSVYVLLVLAQVWTVAYAFVPFGWILRESLPLVLMISTALIVLGLVGSDNSKPFENINACFEKRIRALAVGMVLLTAYFSYEIRPTIIPAPYHPDSKLITAGIWTIHFGFDNDLWESEQRMMDLISDMELDVVGLLETDTQRIATGNRDLTQKIAHDLGMYADFGPGPNKHTWGCVLFSKFPILKSEHHLLPSPVGELAPAIHATIDAYGELIDIFVFHSGQEEDDEDRRLQSEYMSKLMGSSSNPRILLSYLVTDPHEGNYNNYVSEESQMHDIDPTDDDRWCEYILFNGLRRRGYARVSRGTITDTELQVGKFQVLTGEDQHVNQTQLYGNVRIDADQIEDDLKFPEKFLNDGERGHFYHVFDEPRYFD